MQIIDVPVPQVGNQVVPVAEQVIDVPKIFLEDLLPFATFVSRSAAGGTVGGSAEKSWLCPGRLCLEGLFEA